MKLEPVIPFEPVNSDRIPNGDSWTYQVKWDGVRILTYYDGRNIRLFNRKLNERTLQFPELSQFRNYAAVESFILDGEIIAFDKGVPSFQEVMKRDSLRSKLSVDQKMYEVPISYMVFDILYLNGIWITEKPLFERQDILGELIKVDNTVQLVQNFANGEGLYKAIQEQGIEGIICKDLNSSYQINGKDKRWLKKKNYLDIVGIVCGVTLKNNIINSLLIGLYNDQNELSYVGHVGTGKLTNNDWKELTKTIEPLIIEKMPFPISPDRIDKNTIWLTPKLTVKIKFMEWTKSLTMRQPSIQSFLNKPIGECNFEQ